MRLPNLERHAKRIDDFVEQLPRMMHDKFRDETPVLTGNAKRSTVKSGDSIEGNYAYANRLNQGSSRQAPQGMTEPTIEYVRQQLRGVAR